MVNDVIQADRLCIKVWSRKSGNRYPAFYIGKSVRFHYPGTKVQELKAYLQ